MWLLKMVFLLVSITKGKESEVFEFIASHLGFVWLLSSSKHLKPGMNQCIYFH